jgi:hypothetical protein
MKFKQQGVTLIEVLVGFVIFMSSLVVVLDYVSEQIFQVNRTSSNLEQLQLIYQLATLPPHIDDWVDFPEWNDSSMDWSASALVLENYKQRKKEVLLKKINYQVDDIGRKFSWDIIVIE